MAPLSHLSNPLKSNSSTKKKKKSLHLALLSLLIPLALAPSLISRSLSRPDTTLPTPPVSQVSTFPNGSLPIHLASDPVPPIPPISPVLETGSSLSPQITQSPLLKPPVNLLPKPKASVLGGGVGMLQLKSTPKLIKEPQGIALSLKLGSPVQAKSKRRRRRRKGGGASSAGTGGGGGASSAGTGTGGAKIARVVKRGKAVVDDDTDDFDKDDGVCNMYRGIWVKDEEGRYPLYPPGCPFVDNKFACQENGRKDTEYLKWRWKPHSCDLPRFNATDFLEILRDKVIMFVGDSMARNQFGSLLCILRAVLPSESRVYEQSGYKISKLHGHYSVHFPDYNCSVMFAQSFYLVFQDTRTDEKGKIRDTLILDRIDRFASTWKMVDILIFNSGYWWNYGKTNFGKNFFQERGMLYPKLDLDKAYRRGLRTWAAWIDKNLTPEKHTVFFRGQGTSHFSGGAWYNGGKCSHETKPLFQGRILKTYPFSSKIADEIIGRMRFPVTYMNITRLTNYRKDGHPSIYGDLIHVPGSNSLPEDCGHWCLPGVPDTWNELLYANLKMKDMLKD